MSEFKIDFFELMFLAEACIPPRPIARAMFFQDMSDKYYHQMTDNERNRAFEWLTKNDYFKLEEEDCHLFFARFNPKNQYKVSCFHHGKAQEIDCFRFNDKYHTSKNTSVNEEYIKSAVLCERKSTD
jgi:hypothetical protein